jgi:hypothetical protein
MVTESVPSPVQTVIARQSNKPDVVNVALATRTGSARAGRAARAQRRNVPNLMTAVLMIEPLRVACRVQTGCAGTWSKA